MNTHELDFYNISDILEITGLKKSTGYALITKLQEELKADYPNTITLQGKIPKWYFEEKLMNKKREV